MLALLILLIPFLALLQPASSRLHISLSPRDAGPSGTLESPAGGSTYTNLGGATGDLFVSYRGVSDGATDPGEARTISIDVLLVPSLDGDDDTRSNITLANGLRQKVSGSSDAISAYFTPPIDACGDYNLYVTEHQYYYSSVIQFLSAAPAISITCGPIQK